MKYASQLFKTSSIASPLNESLSVRKLALIVGLMLFAFLLSSCKINSQISRTNGSDGSGGSGEDSPSATPPSVVFQSITPSQALGNSSTTFEFQLSYENVQSVSLQNSFLVMNYTGGVTCNPLSINNGTSTSPTLTLTGCTGDGTAQVLLNSGSSQGDDGNSDDGAVSSLVTIDNTAPTVSVASPLPVSGDSSSTFSFTVTYSDANTVNLTAGDVTVNATGPSCDAPIVNNGSTLTPSVTLSNCTGNGTVGITVGANTSSDQAGNQSLASAASATATVTNILTCPSGGVEGEYIPVPGNAAYGTSDFCVMKYEAKARRDLDSQINAWGCIEGTAMCGSSDWVFANPSNEASTPVSVATDRPWREISRNQAIAECQSLGAGFDLISNDEWQTISRNIELQTNNWSEGVVGGVSTGNGGTNSNLLNHGHADGTPFEPLAPNADDNQGCEGTGQTCNGGTGGTGGNWNLEKRTHNLSNSEVIWDFAGNLWEWVKDDNSNAFGGNSYISIITDSTHPDTYSLSGGLTTTARRAKDQFGPLENYSSMNSGNYGGLGNGWINATNGGIRRGGGFFNVSNTGVFASDLTYNSSASNYHTGFRCVFRP